MYLNLINQKYFFFLNRFLSPCWFSLFSFHSIISRCIGRDIPGHSRTWITTTIVIVTIGFIFVDGLTSSAILGNLSALLSAISLSAAFVITRHAEGIHMTPAMAGSALISVVISFIIATSVIISWQSLFIFIALGVFLTLAFSLLFIAPRYISAAEVSLLMPMETVFGTALVWFYIGEEPSIRTIIGGGVIIAVLSINSIIGIRQSSPR